MKNIFLLPTLKPSRLWFDESQQNKLQLTEKGNLFFSNSNVNVCITNDEEIKEGDYWLYLCPINGLDFGDNGNPIVKNKLPSSWFEKLHDRANYKKIVLCTDPELIKNGVQELSNEFLEWFADKANDSGKPIDIVEVGKLRKSSGYYDEKAVWHWDFLAYVPIIPQPKQEPSLNFDLPICQKQETIEEVNTLFELYSNTADEETRRMYGHHLRSFKAGWNECLKHRSENMFTQQELEYILYSFKNYLGFGKEVDEKKWLTQHKNH